MLLRCCYVVSVCVRVRATLRVCATLCALYVVCRLTFCVYVLRCVSLDICPFQDLAAYCSKANYITLLYQIHYTEHGLMSPRLHVQHVHREHLLPQVWHVPSSTSILNRFAHTHITITTTQWHRAVQTWHTTGRPHAIVALALTLGGVRPGDAALPIPSPKPATKLTPSPVTDTDTRLQQQAVTSTRAGAQSMQGVRDRCWPTQLARELCAHPGVVAQPRQATRGLPSVG